MEHVSTATSQQAGVNQSRMFRLIRDYLAANELDIQEALGETYSIDLRATSEHELVTFERLQTMLEQLTAHTSDPALSLRMASLVRPGHIGLLGYLMMSCETLVQAISLLDMYAPLLITENDIRQMTDDDGWHLILHPLLETPSMSSTLLSMGIWVSLGKALTEMPTFFGQVHFTFEAPQEQSVISLLHDVFGRDISFVQADNRLTLPNGLQTLPLAQRDKAMHELLRARADTELANMAVAKGNQLAQLEAVLRGRLDGGDVSISSVAKIFQMEQRTLQRRLHGYGMSYRDVLDGVRRHEAERMVKTTSVPLSGIAYNLGFSDQSSFQHAFRRWTGMSPGAYRQKLQVQMMS